MLSLQKFAANKSLLIKCEMNKGFKEASEYEIQN